MSSKRRIRRRNCDKKKRYVTIEEANGARTSLWKNGERGLNIYKCQFCNGYHIGHRNRNQANGYRYAKENK